MSESIENVHQQLQESKKINEQLEQKEFVEFQNSGSFDEDSTLRDAIIKNPKPINLVFEGGGAKGALFAGALKILENHDFLSEVRNVAGSSAGGMTAFLLALGYTSDEVIKLVMMTDFKTLEDCSTMGDYLNIIGKIASGVGGVYAAMWTGLPLPLAIVKSTAIHATASSSFPVGLGEAFNLFSKSHFWEGKACLALAKTFLSSKDINPDITFEEFHELVQEKRLVGDNSFKDLFLTGTDVKENDVQIFSHLDTPNIKLIDAFRATMSFPAVFIPHVIDMSSVNGRPAVAFADGGMKKNYPMNIFDRQDDDYAIKGGFFGPGAPMLVKVKNGSKKTKSINPYTLGFKVDSKEECESIMFEKQAENNVYPSKSELLNAILVNSDKRVRTYYPDRTIQGYDMGYSTLDFGLSALDKITLMLSGREESLRYIEKMRNLKENPEYVSTQAEEPESAKKARALSVLVKSLSKTSTDRKAVAQQIYNKWVEFLIYEQDPIWIKEIGEALLSQLENTFKTTSTSGSLCSAVQIYAYLQKQISEDLLKTPVKVSMSAPQMVLVMTASLEEIINKAWNYSTILKCEHFLVTEFREALRLSDFEAATIVLSKSPGNTIRVPLPAFFALQELMAHKRTYKVSSFPPALLELEKTLLKKVKTILPEDDQSRKDFETIFVAYAGLGDKKSIAKMITHPFINIPILEKALANQKGRIGIGLRFDYKLQKLLQKKKSILKNTPFPTPTPPLIFSSSTKKPVIPQGSTPYPKPSPKPKLSHKISKKSRGN